MSEAENIPAILLITQSSRRANMIDKLLRGYFSVIKAEDAEFDKKSAIAMAHGCQDNSGNHARGRCPVLNLGNGDFLPALSRNVISHSLWDYPAYCTKAVT
jgi:hypothetical protein